MMPDEQLDTVYGDQNKFPHVSEALVTHLERLYPDRTPDPAWSERDIWIRVGMVKIIRLLRQQLKKRK